MLIKGLPVEALLIMCFGDNSINKLSDYAGHGE